MDAEEKMLTNMHSYHRLVTCSRKRLAANNDEIESPARNVDIFLQF